MLNKKSKKIISVILLVIMLLGCVSSAAFAVSVPSINENPNTGGMENIASTILGIIKWVGIVVAVGMAMILGIKYITSSPDGKAEIKKTMTIYVGGIVLLLSASTIVTIIQQNIN